MKKKLLIPLYKNDVAPRFDLVTEVVIATLEETGENSIEKMIVLPQASSEQLCNLILTEGIEAVICGGIEQEYYEYLTWKKVLVFDSVIGPYSAAIEYFKKGKLHSGSILYGKYIRVQNVE
ncbi:MAG: dinitrogenase iron-molybdenum cofactor biosynthesis protein [Deltaproteobacteria bacterium]|nr:dinitrogenase iron-molybdenum cofactor biosynthesis protein [Deltaproteobacteria bacterium]MBW1960770.1 dinitrogenase iron-molybdenum cofactor biosynthesis protein [Deltaproteobacteria bacterium]MBW1993444.1 dinitrogenase iron-molybdenum cofactor biosynthesis protein [Deltaproteobacteria bacterium]MBW2154186.1 dinitrogenase iron-molybdenum cofactor biosynthesis protein [Deltaproteobacteria bacterium]